MEKFDEKPLLEIFKVNLIDYAEEVIQNRALADFRDGLKPIHRRILWAMKVLGFKHNGPFYKCARVVGDVIGKYHPHGDASIYDALVNMVFKDPVSCIQGVGNFGSLTGEPYAAMRYTECKLSKYSQFTMLDDRYLDVTKKIPTYDGSTVEPLYLPALFPNLLLNGSSGIAVGVTSDIPPIHIDSLMPFIEDLVKGNPISNKRFAKKIKFNWKYGSHCISEQESIIEWLQKGAGVSLYFEPAYKADGDTRTLTITETPPFFNWKTVVENIKGFKKGKEGKEVPKYEFVSSIDDYSDKSGNTEFVVKFKNTIEREDFMDYVKLIMKEFTNYTKTATNVTYRKVSDIEFDRTTVPGVLGLWVDYRTKLEVRMQKKIIENINIDIQRQDWLLLAMASIDIIANILKNSNKPDADLMKALDISEEGAKYILDQAMRRIAKISKAGVDEVKSRLRAEKKEAIKYKNDPGTKLLSDMSANMSLVS